MGFRLPVDYRPAYPSPLPREAIRGKLLELLGLEEIPTSVEFETSAPQETDDGLLLSRITFRNSLGEAIPGIMLLPLEPPALRLPGVVCLPGSGGSAELLADPSFYRREPHTGPLIGWGRELARRGFATLSLSVKGCEGRLHGDMVWWDQEAKALAPYGRTQMGVIVEEVLQAALVLAANQRVDAECIGLTGFSLGGDATWYAMACAPWIRAGAPLCGGLGSMQAYIREGNLERHSSYTFIPNMFRYFDHPEIVAACIAPRPFMMLAPTMDEDMPRSGVEELMRVVEPAYVSAGHPERFKVYQPEGRHEFLPEYFEWMVDWFTQHLIATSQ